jgi:lipopolysaccharide/colanic/teichoic acid biosynthesis glycosyltransferase
MARDPMPRRGESPTDEFESIGELMDNGSNPYVKRCVDLAIAAVAAVLSMPLMALAMVLVKRSSRGPAIYSQVRLGRHGRPFRIYKIRTMFNDCERTTGSVWCLPGDSRITPVGRFLRCTHIDELPQLWNVLRGEMSLVGPRPERPEIAEKLELVLPQFRNRLAARPGVTGLAQVQLPPDTNLESVRRKLVCDLYYIRRQNFWLDLRIMLGTIPGILGVPFSLTRKLLQIPGIEQIDGGGCRQPDSNVSLPVMEIPQAQSQTA